MRILFFILFFIGTSYVFAQDADNLSLLSNFNIAYPDGDISYNAVAEFKVGANGLLLDNNLNLFRTSKIILVEVTGENTTELNGKITIKGNKAKLIIINPNGIVCDHCSFNNVDGVELRAKKYSLEKQDVIGNISIVTPLEIYGDFKFVGGNFKNMNFLKAENINWDLTGDFVNNFTGEIIGKKKINVSCKDFINYNKINTGELLQVTAGNFTGDNSSHIVAGDIKINLTGNLNFKSDFVLEARKSRIELIAPMGNMYFGYKKDFTGAGDNKDGFRFISGEIISPYGLVHIQSGGNVIFDGTKLVGNTLVEAKGEVKENNLTDSFQDGVNIVKHTENKVHIVMQKKTEKIKIYHHTDSWCKIVDFFGSCIGGWGYEDIYNDVNVVKDVPVEEHYVQENFIKTPKFQQVFLNTNFIGDKNIQSNKAEIIFKNIISDTNFINDNNNYNADLGLTHDNFITHQ
jgi:filamentous hemagglutinin family protein